MRVLLVSPNRSRTPCAVVPLGLAYVAAALERAGHEVAALDLCFEARPERAIAEKISSVRPGLVGLSVRNCEPVERLARDVVRHVRAATQAPLVLGGSGLTLMSRAYLQGLKADYAIAGAGEQAAVDLAGQLAQGSPPAPGLFSSSCRSPAPWAELDCARALFDERAYELGGGMTGVQSKRGCPFRCVFCRYPLIEGRETMLRSPERVADEVERLAASGARKAFFVDSVFNHPPGHAEAVCDALAARGLDILWACYANPRFMTRRLAAKMRRAGCRLVSFGTDSLCDEGLVALGKDFLYHHVLDAAQACRDAGLRQTHSIFVGAPGDSADIVRLNLERLDALGADVSRIVLGISVLAGTPLAALASRELGVAEARLARPPALRYVAPRILREMPAVRRHLKDVFGGRARRGHHERFADWLEPRCTRGREVYSDMRRRPSA